MLSRHLRSSRPLAGTISSSKILVRNVHVSSRLANQFKLSDIGEGIVEVEIVKWFVKRGDKVRQFDPLCEVSSDKATVEITSRFDGIVKELGFPVGAKAKVGQTLVEFESSSSSPSSSAKESDDNAGKSETNPQTINTTTTAINVPRREVSSDDLATPAVRHLAKENALDLKRIQGTGKDGRVTKGDVLSYMELKRGGGVGTTPAANTTVVTAVPSNAAQQPPPPPMTTTSLLATKIVPITGIRKEMVKSMTQSLQIPHLGLMEEVEVDEAMKFMQKATPPPGSRSVLPICVKALSLALLRHPDMNATTNEACTELYLHSRHNVGIAMDTPKGLIVPVIYDVQSKSIAEIVEELKRLREAGKEARFSMRDLGMLRPGGSKFEAASNDFATVVLSNVGSVGTGTYTTPVITPPMVAIGGLGKVRAVPRFRDDSPAGTSNEIKRVNVMHVSWAADHRVVDGATVARFAKRFKELVENPLEFIWELR